VKGVEIKSKYLTSFGITVKSVSLFSTSKTVFLIHSPKQVRAAKSGFAFQTNLKVFRSQPLRKQSHLWRIRLNLGLIWPLWGPP